MSTERPWSRFKDDPELARLHGKRFTDFAIADVMEFSVQTIRANLRRLGLSPHKVMLVKAPMQQEKPVAPAKEKPNPLATAMTYLGRRLVEKPSGYWLDGLPASLDNIMRETNRVRARMGMAQILHCERWKV